MMDENELVKFIEPIFHFCTKRLNSRHDAEDLASEIMVHVLNGMKKYHIDSLEKWVWRIAYNRYARFIDMRNKKNEVPYENDFTDIQDDYDFVDEMFSVDEYQQVFKFLHTLSSEYRNILVDYYIGQLPIKIIAKNYELTETTVKWRLNVSREKIKTRIGENKMDKVYKRINWNTSTCNGSVDSDKYLYSQIARAICEAAYEKPLTVEEISLKTGIPTMFIEDELPRLINGDAIVKDGNKYAANFIIVRLCDKKVMETKFAPLVDDIANYFAELFNSQENEVSKIDFYGWFVVYEKETENEDLATTESGCNNAWADDKTDCIHYYWIGKYFHDAIYHNGGTYWLAAKKIVGKADNGIVPDGALAEDDLIRLIKANLIVKTGDKFKLNFAVFNKEQFDLFKGHFDKDNTKLDEMLSELITDIHKSFKTFVPKRLDSQINQWVSSYVHNIIGFVAEELINRNILEIPNEEKPLTNGVFSILGKVIDI